MRDTRINIKRELYLISFLTRRNRNLYKLWSSSGAPPTHRLSLIQWGGWTHMSAPVPMKKGNQTANRFPCRPKDLDPPFIIFLSLSHNWNLKPHPESLSTSLAQEGCRKILPVMQHCKPVLFWLYQDRQWRANHFKVYIVSALNRISLWTASGNYLSTTEMFEVGKFLFFFYFFFKSYAYQGCIYLIKNKYCYIVKYWYNLNN